MNINKELKILLSDNIMMPKMYSFTQVQKLVKHLNKQWEDKIKEALKGEADSWSKFRKQLYNEGDTL